MEILNLITEILSNNFGDYAIVYTCCPIVLLILFFLFFYPIWRRMERNAEEGPEAEWRR